MDQSAAEAPPPVLPAGNYILQAAEALQELQKGQANGLLPQVARQKVAARPLQLLPQGLEACRVLPLGLQERSQPGIQGSRPADLYGGPGPDPGGLLVDVQAMGAVLNIEAAPGQQGQKQAALPFLKRGVQPGYQAVQAVKEDQLLQGRLQGAPQIKKDPVVAVLAMGRGKVVEKLAVRAELHAGKGGGGVDFAVNQPLQDLHGNRPLLRKLGHPLIFQQ